MNDSRTYEVVFDPEVSRKSAIEIIKKRKAAWIGCWLRWSATVAVIIWFLLYTGTFHDRKKDFALLIGMAVVLSLLLCFVYLWEYIRKENEANVRTNLDKRWTCTMDPEKWTFEDQDGVVTAIPWNHMRITEETPDVWYVTYGGREIFVFREPLRAAGLEDEFKSRIPTGKTT